MPETSKEVSGEELVFEEKRLRNDGTDTARSEQADQGSKEMDEKNHQMAHASKNGSKTGNPEES